MFIDFREAYDRVDRRVLLRLIKEKGILTTEQLQLLQFLLTNTSTHYGRHSSRMTNGVPQGSTIAPSLFNIVMEALNETFDTQGIAGFDYADDVTSLGNDAEVMTALRTIEEWADRNNMLINKTKSGILPLNGSAFRTGDIVMGYPVV